MNEQEQISQLSALFDNELAPGEAELVIRRALKDPALRARWERYALIGACLRNEPLHPLSRPDVAERVRASLAAETERPQGANQAVVPYPGQRTWFQFGRGALGGAIAAGVAAVALVLFRSLDSGSADPAVQMADAGEPVAASEVQPMQVAPAVQTPALAAVTDTPPAIYTTPVDNSARRASGPLAGYVAAHSAVAASAGRLLPLSAVNSGSYDLAKGAVEMTEAQIGAYR